MCNKKQGYLQTSLLWGLKLVAVSLLFFSCKPAAVLGQGGEANADKVAEIHQQIKVYQEKIEPCKDGEPCGAFANRNIINEHAGPWPAVGTYRIDRTFWYHRIFNEEEGEYAYQLDMVLVKTNRSAREENEVFFFDAEGNFVYYEFLLGDAESNTQHIQFYFENNKLLHHASEIADEEADYREWKKEDYPSVQKLGAALTENFHLDMQER